MSEEIKNIFRHFLSHAWEFDPNPENVYSLTLDLMVEVCKITMPVLLTLGTTSLRVYAFHLPFAYGALGEPVRALSDTSVAAATPAVLGLIALTYALVRASDGLRDRFRAWRYTRSVP